MRRTLTAAIVSIVASAAVNLPAQVPGGAGGRSTLEPSAMPTLIQTLSTTDQLERALDQSVRRPLVIFKHSPTCGISAQAFESISEWLARDVPGADFYIVPVPAGRALSTQLAQKFGIRHESPQVMVIDRGEVVWHGSHHRATAESIAAALGKLVAAT